jgi:NAD(P)-dependent dehydrogenase (short-subunit alcohol dehydrogenase family)
MSNTVLITGTGRGLGVFLAEEYLERGAVVFGLNRAKRDGNELAAKHPDRYQVFECDVSNERQVREAADKIARLTTSVDILINNAAIYREKPFTQMNEFDADIVRVTFEVNAIGPLLVTKQFMPLVIAGKGKTIVNVSSEAGSISQCWRDREYGYCMSKAALNMQSVILQNKLRPQGVKVLAIHPGWMRTDMGGQDADLDPRATAAELVDTIAKNGSLDGPIYIDHAGKPMQW